MIHAPARYEYDILLCQQDTGAKVEREIVSTTHETPTPTRAPPSHVHERLQTTGVECQSLSGVWAVGCGSQVGCVHGEHEPLQHAIPEHARLSLIPCIGSEIEHLRYTIPCGHDYSRPLLCICHDPFLKSSSGTVWLQHSMSLAVASDLFSVANGGQSLLRCRDTTSRSLTFVLRVGGIVYLGDLDYIRFVMSCPSSLPSF